MKNSLAAIKGLLFLFVLLTFLNVAIAQDISEFPDNFVENNVLSANIIVSDNAAGQDYIGAAQVMKNLLSIKGGIEDEQPENPNYSYKIENTNDILEGGEVLSDVRDVITQNEFKPLESGTVTTEKATSNYEQFLILQSGSSVVHQIADGVPDDKERIPSIYLKLEKSIPAYEYKIVFNPPLESDVDANNNYTLKDLEGEDITLLGNKYTIVETKHSAKDDISLTLVGGSIRDLIREGQTKTYTIEGKDYNLSLMFVSNSENQDIKARISFNGKEFKNLREREYYNIDDNVNIYIREILVNDREGVVDFSLGGSKIVLRDTNISDASYGDKRWEVNNEDVRYTDTKIEGIDDGLSEGAEVKINTITVKWTPNKDYFVGVGQKLSDILQDKNQIFGKTFDFSHEVDLSRYKLEVVQLTPSGNDEYDLTFVNKLGQILRVPMFFDNTGTFSRFGDDDHNLILEEGTNITREDYFMVTSDGSENLLDANGYTHLLQYESQDISENIIEFEDVGSGESIEVHYDDGDTTAKLPLMGEEYLISFSDSADDGSIQVDLDNNGSIHAGDVPAIVTGLGLAFGVDTTGAYAYRRFTAYSNEKEESILGPTLNALLVNIGAGLQATLGLSENPVNDTEAITRFYDSVRFTIEDDSEEIDIASIERCVDGANPHQIEQAISKKYDGNATITAALGGKILSQYVYDTYFDSVCYPIGTNTAQFLYTIGDTNDEQGVTTFGQKVVWERETGDSDKASYFSLDKELENLVFIKSQLYEDNEETSSGLIKRDVDTNLDSNIVSIDKNLILIGGPCVNKITAEILGNEADCSEGFEPGKARILLTEYKGRKAIVVAGYEAEDTLLAVKILLEKPYLLKGADLSISGTFEDPLVEEYTPPLVVEEEPSERKVVEEPKKIEEPSQTQCRGSNDETGTYELELSKLGIKKHIESHPRVKTDGLKAEVIYDVSEPFKAQLGVDWLQYIAHIHQGGCDGPEITALTFKWVDGDKDKKRSFELPEKGCYCLKITNNDVSIDDASIEMVSGGGEFTMEFSTNSPEKNLLTGNVVNIYPRRPLNDMNVLE